MKTTKISIAQARSILAYDGVPINAEPGFASFVNLHFLYHGKGVDDLHRYTYRIALTNNVIEVKLNHNGYSFQENYNIKSLTISNKIGRKWMSRIIDCENVKLITNLKRYTKADKKYIESIDINAIVLDINHLRNFFDHHNKRTDAPYIMVTDIHEGKNKHDMFWFDSMIINKQMILSGVKYTKEQWDELDHTKMFLVREFDNGYSHWGVDYYPISKDDFQVGKTMKVIFADERPKNFSQSSST